MVLLLTEALIIQALSECEPQLKEQQTCVKFEQRCDCLRARLKINCRSRLVWSCTHFTFAYYAHVDCTHEERNAHSQ